MSDDLLEEKRAVARKLISFRYPSDNPAFDISATLDEFVERVALADFFNGPAASWLNANTRWEWQSVDHTELIGIETVRDLGKVCFAHLALKPSQSVPGITA